MSLLIIIATIAAGAIAVPCITVTAIITIGIIM
jgi:hypothetical protein